MSTKLIFTLLVFTHCVILSGQIDIPGLSLQISNVKPLSKSSITEEIIEDSINLAKYEQILENDLLLTVRSISGDKVSSHLNRIKAINYLRIQESLEREFITPYLNEKGEFTTLNILKIELPNSSLQFMGEYDIEFNNKLITFFFILNSEKLVKQTLSIFENIVVKGID